MVSSAAVSMIYLLFIYYFPSCLHCTYSRLSYYSHLSFWFNKGEEIKQIKPTLMCRLPLKTWYCWKLLWRHKPLSFEDIGYKSHSSRLSRCDAVSRPDWQDESYPVLGNLPDINYSWRIKSHRFTNYCSSKHKRVAQHSSRSARHSAPSQTPLNKPWRYK